MGNKTVLFIPIFLLLFFTPIALAEISLTTKNELKSYDDCGVVDCCSVVNINNYDAPSLTALKNVRVNDLRTWSGDIKFNSVSVYNSTSILVCGKIKELKNYWGIKDLWNSTWWNSSCNYKQNITISYGGDNATLTNYQTLINVTKDTNMTNGDTWVRDLWFYNYTDGTYIYYWNMTQTSDYADIWIKVPVISNTTATIVDMYYNCSIDNIPNGNETFLFYDNFEGDTMNATKWLFTADDTDISLTIAGGYAHWKNDGSAGTTQAIWTTNEIFTQPKKVIFTINASADFCPTSTAKATYCGFTNATTGGLANNMATYSHADWGDGQNCKMYSHDADSGNYGVSAPTDLSKKQVYIVTWNSTNETTSNETTNYIGHYSTTADLPQTTAPAGCYGNENSAAHSLSFDYFAVAEFVDEEPTVVFGSELEQPCSCGNWSSIACVNTTHTNQTRVCTPTACNTTAQNITNSSCTPTTYVTNLTAIDKDLLGHFCIDNRTLKYNGTYQGDLIEFIKTCSYGCDNVTNVCSPNPFYMTTGIIGVIILVMIFVAWVFRGRWT